jgi:hypothetical protein
VNSKKTNASRVHLFLINQEIVVLLSFLNVAFGQVVLHFCRVFGPATQPITIFSSPEMSRLDGTFLPNFSDVLVTLD